MRDYYRVTGEFTSSDNKPHWHDTFKQEVETRAVAEKVVAHYRKSTRRFHRGIERQGRYHNIRIMHITKTSGDGAGRQRGLTHAARRR